jgi:transposase InsO family protein
VEQHHRRYGLLRVRKALWQDYGKSVSWKKVAQLMWENGLNARRKRKFIPTTNSNHGLPVCANLLDRQFHAEQGGQKWMSSYQRYAITYLRTSEGWVYLTIVLDLFDRKVIGWALSADLEAVHTTIPVVNMVFKNRPVQEGLLVHSDRGAQYYANSFRDVLQERCPSVCQSMSHKGNCRDNACAETFFKTLKGELETLGSKHSEPDVRQSVSCTSRPITIGYASTRRLTIRRPMCLTQGNSLNRVYLLGYSPV